MKTVRVMSVSGEDSLFVPLDDEILAYLKARVGDIVMVEMKDYGLLIRRNEREKQPQLERD